MEAATLVLTVRPSRLLAGAVVLLHLLAAVAVSLAELPWAARAALFAALLASLVRAVRQPGDLRLRCGPDGGLEVETGDDWRPAVLLPDTLVLPWFTVLRYRPEGSHNTATRVILADGLPADDFRRLRIWLRWRARTGPTRLASPAGGRSSGRAPAAGRSG